MTNRHIKVQYHDGDNPVVYENDRILTEKEIVDLLVEGFEDVDVLIKCLEEVRHELVSISGLKAFDKVYDGKAKYVCIPLKDLIDLEYSNLIKKIDEAIT